MMHRDCGGGELKEATTCESLLAKLRKFKERQGEEYGLRSIGIFGSFARGEAREDSDVDIVFETSAPNLFRTSRMRQDLEEFLGRPVDVLQLRGLTNPRLKARVEKEARYV
jgi:predicted nucleotidyltransferase